MPRCRQCNLRVSSVAEICPRCGSRLPTRFPILTGGIVAGLIIFGLLAIAFVAVQFRGFREDGATTPKQVASLPFVVEIQASVTGGLHPIVTGTTNLPDDAELIVTLSPPWAPNAQERLAAGLPACGGSACGPFRTDAKLPGSRWAGITVKGGRFRDGPFTDNGAALTPGKYVLEISLVSDFQSSPNVRAILGPHGENTRGPLVNGCCFGPSSPTEWSLDEIRRAASILDAPSFYARYWPRQNTAEAIKRLDKFRRDAQTVGAIIYYARYVEIR